jgi:hypothetical protein
VLDHAKTLAATAKATAKEAATDPRMTARPQVTLCLLALISLFLPPRAAKSTRWNYDRTPSADVPAARKSKYGFVPIASCLPDEHLAEEASA